jgi:hypothetical protein
MSDTLHCPCCDRDADGLTFYSIAGVFRLLVCASCYGLLVAKEHQPHSKLMQRLRRLLGLNGREVVSHAGAGGRHTALGHDPLAVAQEEAQLQPVSVAEPGVGFVSRNTQLKRRVSPCGS